MSSAADDVYRRDVFYFVQTVPPAALNDAGRARLRDIANSFLQTTQNAEMQALLALVHGIYDLRPYMTPANLNPVVRNVLQVTNNAAVQVQTARSRTTVNPTSVMTTTTTALATAMPTGSLTWVSTSHQFNALAQQRQETQEQAGLEAGEGEQQQEEEEDGQGGHHEQNQEVAAPSSAPPTFPATAPVSGARRRRGRQPVRAPGSTRGLPDRRSKDWLYRCDACGHVVLYWDMFERHAVEAARRVGFGPTRCDLVPEDDAKWFGQDDAGNTYTGRVIRVAADGNPVYTAQDAGLPPYAGGNDSMGAPCKDGLEATKQEKRRRRRR